MIRTQRSSPVPRFLEVSGEAGPLELLGLGPTECTSSRIEAALQRQLDRVASHPEGDTPEADEVRLALHSAAAQLLDPQIRGQVIAQHVSSLTVVEVDVAPVPPVAEEVRRVAQTPPAISRSAPIKMPAPPPEDSGAPVRRLLMYGGVFVALAAVVLVAVAIFFVPTTVVTTPKAGGGSGAAVTPDGKAASGSPTPSAAPAAGSGAPSSSEATAANKPSTGRAEFVDGALVVRDLRAASALAKTDAAAGLAAFRKAIAPLADWWPRYDVGQRRAADDAVLEFLYVVNDKPGTAGEAIGELSRRATLPAEGAGSMSADAVWPAAWATGMLMRASAERELPRSLAAGVAGAINDVLGAGRPSGVMSFEGGVEAALRRMPLRLVDVGKAAGADPFAPRTSVEAAKRWADAVAAVSVDGREQERLVVEGLEQVLVHGPEPDTDAAAYETVEILVTRARWRSGGPARERLIEWFNDPRISSADLRVLTGVLTSKSNAEGVDATMMLSVTATPDDRAQLLAKYAQAWGLTRSEARDKAMEDWRAYALGGFGIPGPDDDLTKVAGLVVAVRVNQAGRRLWLGDAAGCSRLIADIDRIPNTIRDIGTPTVAPRPLPGPGPGAPNPAPGRGPGGGKLAAPPTAEPYSGSGPWAESYLKAERNIPVRLQRLLEAESLTMPLSKVDAGLLAEQACFASPFQVRAAAQRLVVKFADDPSIVQACLDELPLAPKVQSVSEMLSRVSKTPLPKVGDPEWEITARRALVDRLLGLLAGQGPQAGIDQAAALIGESYVSMAGVESGPPDESAADRCVRGASQLFRLWRMEADRLPPPERPPVGLEQIERRRRSRQQIAAGPIQAFAGEQVSVAEMLAYLVCAERPVQATRAVVIIDEMAAARRKTGHIFEQMTVTERAISRLWLLRFGEVGQ